MLKCSWNLRRPGHGAGCGSFRSSQNPFAKAAVLRSRNTARSFNHANRDKQVFASGHNIVVRSAGVALDDVGASSQSSSNDRAQDIVVVGAGPAGMLTSMLLAKHGYTVHVYEKRPRPTIESANYSRAYAMGFVPRFVKLVKLVGAQPRWFNKDNYTRGMAFVKQDDRNGFFTATPTRDRSDLSPDFYMGDWPSLMMSLVDEAERLFGNRIHMHFEHEVTTIDFSNRIARFKRVRQDDDKENVGDEVVVQYGTLLASDGANSRVRKMLEAEPSSGLEVGYFSPPRRYYKVIPRLSAQHAPAWLPQHENRGVLYTKFEPTGLTVIVWKRPFAEDFTAMLFGRDVSLLGTETGGSGVLTAENAQQYMPHFTPQWRDTVLQHIDDVPLSDLPAAVIRCNKLYVPGVVLLGDAGHAQTFSMGLGSTSAAVAAETFVNAVKRCNGDFDAAGEAYNRKHLVNSRCLQFFEQMTSMAANPPSRTWWFQPMSMLLWPSKQVGVLLSRIDPQRYSSTPYHSQALSGGSKSFARVFVEIVLMAAAFYGGVAWMAVLIRLQFV